MIMQPCRSFCTHFAGVCIHGYGASLVLHAHAHPAQCISVLEAPVDPPPMHSVLVGRHVYSENIRRSGLS